MSVSASERQRGLIIPIGGAEEKLRKPEVLEKFVDLCGRTNARLAIIPTASELDDTGSSYQSLFERLGVRSATVLPISSREDAQNPEYLAAIEQADGVFMTGGNQLRLSTLLGGTPITKAIRQRNLAGMHVAGTSAGAAYMPEHMIAGGRAGATPSPNKVTLAPGLGLTNRLVIDQHFSQRDRLGRLLTALAYNPYAIGLGLDEDTAAFIQPGVSLQVVGSGGVTIVDTTDVSHTSIDQARHNEVVSLIGVKLHILISGGTFDISSRQAFA